jgi:hypothetical protein
MTPLCNGVCPEQREFLLNLRWPGWSAQVIEVFALVDELRNEGNTMTWERRAENKSLRSASAVVTHAVAKDMLSLFNELNGSEAVLRDALNALTMREPVSRRQL